MSKMDSHEFTTLAQTLAHAWSSGDADTAASCFTPDVVYVEPGDRQRYAGRDEVFELSGGQAPPPMSMAWHHLVFDQERQLGCGEYTFRGRRQYHGLVIMQIRDGRISRWREYQYPSESDWADFVGDSRFAGQL